MAGLDTSFYNSMKPIDTGDPMEYARNAMAARTAGLQQQQMQFNLMKSQNDFQYQQQQRAQAAAAYAKEQAAEKAANAFYGKTGAPASVTAMPSEMPGASSDVGMMGGAQGYTPGSVNTMVNPAQPKNFDDAIAAALAKGDPASLFAARKLMAQKEAENTYKKSNLGVTQEEDKTAKGKSDVAKAGSDAQTAELNRAAHAMAYHANILPSVTPENYAAWRANALKDLPNLAGVVPEQPPTDPAQFAQFKQALMMKASDGIKTHYEKITNGDQTYIVGIDAQGKATPVPGTEGTTKPTKEQNTKLQQLQEYRDTLKKQLDADPNNEGLKQKYNEAGANIAKEAKYGDKGLPPLDKGYTYNEAGEAVLIPGSKADRDTRLKAVGDYKKVNGTIGQLDEAIKNIDAILDPKNQQAFNDNFGGYVAKAGADKLTGATATTYQMIQKLKSNASKIGLDDFRVNGSIGAMTEKEWPLVRDAILALDPKMPAADAAREIKNFSDRMKRYKDDAVDTYNLQWGGTRHHVSMKGGTGVQFGDAPSGNVPTAPTGATPSADDLVKMYSGQK